MLKRTITMFLCCILAMSLVLTGCGSKDKETTKTNDGESTEAMVSAPNYEAEYYDGDADGIVATVNGEEVSVQEFNYFLMMSMYNELMMAGEEAGDDFWTNDKIESVMESAMNQAVLSHVYRTAAKAEGVEVSEQNIQDIDASIESGAQYYGSEENFDKFFESQALTKDLYRELTIRSYYASNLFEKYLEENVSADDVMSKFKKDYVKAKHILIQKTNAEGTDISAEAYSKIEDIKAQLDAGADFDQLMAEHGEDPGAEASPEGYVFTTGEMVAEFEEAAFALEAGQLSDIVETDYGYHIIKKLELTDEDIQNPISDAYGNQMTIESTIKSTIGSDSFNGYLEERKSEAEVKINSTEYDKFAVDTHKLYSDFMARSEEITNELNEMLTAAAESATTEVAE